MAKTSPLWEIQKLHEVTRGTSGIRVAVIDGPVDTSHPSFLKTRFEFPNGNASRPTSSGPATVHGTHVASIILGRDGIAPNCTGLVIPIYDEKNGQVQPASQEALAAAIHRAIDHRAHVINVSGGQLAPLGNARPLLAQAVERCHDENVLLVAAVGNDGCACLHVPGALPSVLAVGAADREGRPLASSNWSGPYQIQGVLAPGQGIPGALPGGGATEASGSSYATAVVSGAAALFLSFQSHLGLAVDPRWVRKVILQSVRSCDPLVTVGCHRYLMGHFNPRAAMSLIITQGVDPMSEKNAPEQGTSQLTTQVDPPTDMLAISPSSEPQDVNRDTMSAALQEAAPQPQPGTAFETPTFPSGATSPMPLSTAGLEPAGCACGGGEDEGLAYVLGQVDYDFGTIENLDWFQQNAKIGLRFINPNVPAEMLEYLEENPEFARSLIWTVKISGVPVYAVNPEDCYCDAVYKRLRAFLAKQIGSTENGMTAGVQSTFSFNSIPARVKGVRQLLNGAIVPELLPDPRGMFHLTSDANFQELFRLERELTPTEQMAAKSYIRYIVEKERNLGRTRADRSINYIAVQGFFSLFGAAFSEAGVDSTDIPGNIDSFRLQSIQSLPNSFCLPGGACQDVSLTLFNPTDAVNTAPVVLRQTVDVAAVNPVLVGDGAIYRVV